MKLERLIPSDNAIAARIALLPPNVSTPFFKGALPSKIEDYCLRRKEDLNPITSALIELYNACPNEEQARSFSFAVDHWIGKGVGFTDLTRGFARLVSKGADFQTLGLYAGKACEYLDTPYRLNLALKIESMMRANAPPGLLASYLNCLDDCYLNRRLPVNVDTAYNHLASLRLQSDTIQDIDNELNRMLKQQESNPSLLPRYVSVLKGADKNKLETFFLLKKDLPLPSAHSNAYINLYLKLISLNLDDSRWEVFRESALNFNYEPKSLIGYMDAFTRIVNQNPNASVDLLNDFAVTWHHNQKVHDFSDEYVECYAAFAKYGYEREEYQPLVDAIFRTPSERFFSDTKKENIQAVGEICSKNPSKVVRKAIVKMITALKEKKIDLSIVLLHLAEFDYSDRAVEIPLNAFANSLASGNFGPETVISDIRKIDAHLLARKLLRGKDDETTASKLSRIIVADSMPVVDNGSRSRDLQERMLGETFSVMRDAYDSHEGSESLTFECRRPFDKEPCLLARCGNDLGKAEYVYAEDINQFPGRGVVLSNLNPQNIFARDDGNAANPYALWVESIKTKPFIFEDFEKTSFVFTRGVGIISCPKSTRYEINGVNYSYLYFNNHFHTGGMNVAFLVPTDVVMEKLGGSLIPFGDGPVAKKTNTIDVNNRDFSLRGLIKRSNELGLSVLNIGCPSNLAGGLCNAFPPKSSPYFTWEENVAGSMNRDLYGHYHKAHILEAGVDGGYIVNPLLMAMDVGRLHSTYEKAFIPLRKAHHEVYSITKAFQDLHLLQRLSLSLWHKGQTFGDSIDVRLNDDEESSDESNSSSNQFGGVVSDDSVLVSNNSGSIRMLRECYRWNSGRSVTNDKSKFPLLLVSSVLRYSDKPSLDVILDTFDMTLFVDEEGDKKIIPFNLSEVGDIELGAWKRYVMERVESDIWKDLRFYSREAVGL